MLFKEKNSCFTIYRQVVARDSFFIVDLVLIMTRTAFLEITVLILRVKTK